MVDGRTRILWVLAATSWAWACSSQVRRFPLKEPLWEDTDRNHVRERPSKYYSGLMADGADMIAFYPLARLPTFPLSSESVNVNAIDEVPNSAWFVNRIGFFDMPPEAAYRGACGDAPSLDPGGGPWTVVSAKPNGANPGFFIKAPDGHSYLLKFDGPQQPTRATGSDVIGSKLYWLAGYHTPCNEVVYFPKDIFEISPDAKAENNVGEDEPMTAEHVNQVLLKAYQLKDGRLRASASRFVPGKPLGPFRYQNTRSDDPNDVIPHQNRRELRASQVLAAWINHFDSREQNTLDVWVEDGGRNYIRHYFIDWGDSLGGRWPHDQVSRRLGRSYYWDWGDIGLDLVTLGLYPRVWNQVELNEFEIFGYLDGETFTSSEWKGGYPNPAHDAMTPRDALWMVRILDRITPEHVRSAVRSARFPDDRHAAFITKRLLERRHRTLQEYLTRYAPLARFTLARRSPPKREQSLCFEDLALKHSLASPRVTHYKARFRGGALLDSELGFMQFTPDPEHPHRSCIVLPIGYRRPSDLAPKGARADHPLRYGVLDLFIHQTQSVRPTSSMKLHFYDLGVDEGYRLVAIERPPEPSIPDFY